MANEQFFVDAVSSHNISQAVVQGDTQAIFKAQVMEAIAEEIQDGLFTVSVSTSGQSSQDVQYVTAILNQLDYQASVTGTNLVINW
jgi:hypothetical protein